MTKRNYFREIQEISELLNSLSNQSHVSDYVDMTENFQLQDCNVEDVFSFDSREIQEISELLNDSSNQDYVSDYVDMTENFQLQNCNVEDVFSFDSRLVKVGGLRDIIKSAFIKCEQLLNLISNALKQKHGVEILLSGSFKDDGIKCEILKLGATSWQKGKVKIRVSLEFCPDEAEIVETEMLEIYNSKKLENSQPESPLDDIRRMITENS